MPKTKAKLNKEDSMSQVKSKEYDNIEIEADGNLYDVEFVREWRESSSEYGADADGNRGVLQLDVEDDIAIDVIVKIPATGAWKDLNTFHKSVKDPITEAINQWLVDNPTESED